MQIQAFIIDLEIDAVRGQTGGQLLSNPVLEIIPLIPEYPDVISFFHNCSWCLGVFVAIKYSS